MNKTESSSASTRPPGSGPLSSTAAELSAEDKSKDEFFVQLAEIADAMIKRHGKDFTMGALVLTARFIAENKPLVT
jgi:hypothetical protein